MTDSARSPAAEGEAERIMRERDYWRALAEICSCKLHGWDGMPPNGATFILPTGSTIEVPGVVAAALTREVERRREAEAEVARLRTVEAVAHTVMAEALQMGDIHADTIQRTTLSKLQKALAAPSSAPEPEQDEDWWHREGSRKTLWKPSAPETK